MDAEVQMQLAQDYELDFGAFVCGEAEARCKHGCDLRCCGIYVIPPGATLGSPDVRRAFNHARRCKIVQSFKLTGQTQRIGGRKRIAALHKPTVPNDPDRIADGPMRRSST